MLHTERREDQFMKSENEKTLLLKKLKCEIMEQLKYSDQLLEKLQKTEEECQSLKRQLQKKAEVESEYFELH
jgi:hypothetical protein